MTTFTYNSTSLPVKDRLTISNLLTLFKSRLSATWAQAGPLKDQPVHVVLIDVDQPEGLKKWEVDTGREVKIAVTEDDRSRRQPFVSRPIRAFGANGVIVLFNSIAQSLSSPAREDRIEHQREPARIRMMGRMETSAPPVRAIVPQPPHAPKTATARAATPPPPVESPVPARVAVRWGPPQPVTLPPLIQMPGAKIHWRRPADQQQAPAISRPATSTPAPVAPPAAPKRLWSAPGADALPPLVSMPTTHRPVEIHTAPAQLIGRMVSETAAPPKAAPPAADPVAPTLRPSPPLWRAPEKEAARPLIDFRPASQSVAKPVQDVPEIAESPALVATPEPVTATAASTTGAEQELEIIFAELEPSLESLARVLADEGSPADLSEQDAAVDWWGTADLETSGDDSSGHGSEGSTLIAALKAVKASAQPSILEIPGLPAVCVIPSRNVYFTTAPAARLETAIDGRAEVTWRACASEPEARQLSGTERSRQASLEQLSWTASLLSAPADPAGVTDRAVRLRRWPPITESRGRSKFIRYATMLSGAQASPRELSEITGDPLDEIVRFVNACSIMNLLDTSAQDARSAVLAAPVRTAGAGILRDMIQQLAPPKV